MCAGVSPTMMRDTVTGVSPTMVSDVTHMGVTDLYITYKFW